MSSMKTDANGKISQSPRVQKGIPLDLDKDPDEEYDEEEEEE